MNDIQLFLQLTSHIGCEGCVILKHHWINVAVLQSLLAFANIVKEERFLFENIVASDKFFPVAEVEVKFRIEDELVDRKLMVLQPPKIISKEPNQLCRYFLFILHLFNSSVYFLNQQSYELFVLENGRIVAFHNCLVESHQRNHIFENFQGRDFLSLKNCLEYLDEIVVFVLLNTEKAMICAIVIPVVLIVKASHYPEHILPDHQTPHLYPSNFFLAALLWHYFSLNQVEDDELPSLWYFTQHKQNVLEISLELRWYLVVVVLIVSPEELMRKDVGKGLKRKLKDIELDEHYFLLLFLLLHLDRGIAFTCFLKGMTNELSCDKFLLNFALSFVRQLLSLFFLEGSLDQLFSEHLASGLSDAQQLKDLLFIINFWYICIQMLRLKLL